MGENEVEDAMRRLDRLTQDEARMTVAQTLGVVHGLLKNIKVVMEGASCVIVVHYLSLSTLSLEVQASTDGIRQLVSEMNKAKRLSFPCSTLTGALTLASR